MTATPAQVEALAPDWLTFYRAADWGAIWKRPPVVEGQADAETYIHHGAGGRFGLDPIAAMRALQKWYHDVKNYSTVAYDVMVHRNTADDSVAILGAREGWLSAATRDRNDIGEAICLFGYFHPGHRLSERPHPRELEALAFAVAWSIAHGWSAPDTCVMGHRDNPAHPGATGCPGDYLYPSVPDIARRARQILQQAEAATKPTPPPVSSEHVLRCQVDPGDGWWSIARRAYAVTEPGTVAAIATELERVNQGRPLVPGSLVVIPGHAELFPRD